MEVVTAPSTPDLPAAVLWDMDGTLVDTEPLWDAEVVAMVEEAGGVWREQDSLDLVGLDLLDAAGIILERTPVRDAPEEVVHRMLEGVVARTREHLPWRPGALELLSGLGEAGVPCALVTMSWTALAQVLLARLPAGTFAAVVTGDEVAHGKPHPEPYLEAARRLAVDPAACVAVEDSPAGATSATAAGVPTLVVPHTVAVREMAGARQVTTLAGLAPTDLLALVRG